MFRKFSEPISNWSQEIEQELTIRKYAKGIGAAAVVGLVVGIILAKIPEKKLLKDIDNKSQNSKIIIEVQNVKDLKIERSE